MKKVFTSVLPDEPYKTTTHLNNTVECTYDGPRYLLLRIVAETGAIFCIDEEEETIERIEAWKIEPHKLEDEGHYQVVLDAMEHTWEAAYVTGYYTHEPFDNPVFTNPDGTTWTYHYDDTSCAVEQPFYVNDMFHDKATGTWKRPRYRTHAVAKRDFWNGVKIQIETYTAVCEGSYLEKGYTAEQVAACQEHLNWLLTCEEKYKDVDHWKITLPALKITMTTQENHVPGANPGANTIPQN
jgi:hypothetical protein